MIATGLKSGFSQMWANRRMVVLYYSFNLLFGFLVLLPFWMLARNLSKESQILEMDGGWAHFIFDIINHDHAALGLATGLLGIVAMVYFLLALFLSGGVLGIFGHGDSFTGARFWGHAGGYFFRFFRLLLWSLPVGLVLFYLRLPAVGIERLFFGETPYENISFWFGFAANLSTLLGLFLYHIILDYARIDAVVTGRRKMRISLVKGIRVTFGHFFSTFGLALTLFLMGAITLGFYYLIRKGLDPGGNFLLLVVFLIQQAVIFFRMMLKLALYAGECRLYTRFMPPEPVSETRVTASIPDETPADNPVREGEEPLRWEEPDEVPIREPPPDSSWPRGGV